MIDYIIKKLEVPKSIVKVTIDDKKLMIPHRTINKGSKVLRQTRQQCSKSTEGRTKFKKTENNDKSYDRK